MVVVHQHCVNSWITLLHAQQNKARIGVIAFHKLTGLVCSTFPSHFSSTLVGLGNKNKNFLHKVLLFSHFCSKSRVGSVVADADWRIAKPMSQNKPLFAFCAVFLNLDFLYGSLVAGF